MLLHKHHQRSLKNGKPSTDLATIEVYDTKNLIFIVQSLRVREPKTDLINNFSFFTLLFIIYAESLRMRSLFYFFFHFLFFGNDIYIKIHTMASTKHSSGLIICRLRRVPAFRLLLDVVHFESATIASGPY